MVLYTCSNCLKEFNKVSHYKRHINRKNPCKKSPSITKVKIRKQNPVKKSVPKMERSFQNRNVFKCEFCNSTYSRKPNLNKHLKTCKKKEKKEMMDIVEKNGK